MNYIIEYNYKILYLHKEKQLNIDKYDLKDKHLKNRGITPWAYKKLTQNQKIIVNCKITNILKKDIDLNSENTFYFKEYWFKKEKGKK